MRPDCYLPEIGGYSGFLLISGPPERLIRLPVNQAI
jgi:hypothetical protein